jgi:hypothetical protein
LKKGERKKLTSLLDTSTAILDGTQSSDDSGTVASYAWEIHSGPLGYQPVLPPVPTLTLENLVAGIKYQCF